MCAGYGLGGGPHDVPMQHGLDPMDETESRELISQWASTHAHRAKITGRIARNLNPVIRAQDGARTLDLGWWWLHVGGQPAKFSAFNSRDDSLVKKWRAPFQRRALLPANWYIEKGQVCALPHDELFGIAAITTTVEQADGSELLTYSMVTREAVGAASEVHHRMPMLLPRSFHDDWLDGDRAGDDELVAWAQLASSEIGHQVRTIGALDSKKSSMKSATNSSQGDAPTDTLF